MNKTRREPFGRLPDGEESALYTLCAENGLCVSITNYGGTITSILAPDREGALGDVVLGYDTLDGYLTGRSYFGASIGRFGNRINRGRFTLDGSEYILNVNDGQHHLHGVAGNEEEHAEDGEGDPEEDRHHREDTPGEIRQHACGFCRIAPSGGRSCRSGSGTR